MSANQVLFGFKKSPIGCRLARVTKHLAGFGADYPSPLELFGVYRSKQGAICRQVAPFGAQLHRRNLARAITFHWIPISGLFVPRGDMFAPFGVTWWTLGAAIGAKEILNILKFPCRHIQFWRQYESTRASWEAV
jgi:hypothetical protein